ncbi:uncharacterized protein LOC110057747 isoform X2 [Orbicella faveolata]|uniref:uncharacterized protein LOC110057747 isoform X2 n=1 Tax=Orbicella faveolata TaxID=48498 RepID=UPI0009E47E6A|nr:uncharacterized protein LOC110057747 isoform X2 [Orbicella faveolata]
MKCYSIVSAFVILVLVISVGWGKHKGRRLKNHRHKHVQLFNVKHLRHSKNAKLLAYHGHIHFRGHHHHHHPARLKCRRVKLLVNSNLQLKKKTTDAMKRHLSKKHAKRMLHKFITSRKHKRFHLPKDTKLFKDKEGNLITYIEDCVASENAEKKNFFEGQNEMFIAPAYDEKKSRHDHHSSENNDVTTVQANENDVNDEGILPASEDALLHTVSDSTDILKDSAQKEATVYQAVALDNPPPKKPEEGSELQRFFSSTGLTPSMPQLNSDVVTPISQQPVNNFVPEHDNQLQSPASLVTPISQQPVNNFVPEHDNQLQSPASQYITNPAPPPQRQAYTQALNLPRIRTPLRNHRGKDFKIISCRGREYYTFHTCGSEQQPQALL